MFSKVLVAFNINKNDLRNRLSNCQVYSEIINNQILARENIEKGDSLNVFELIRLLNKMSDKTVTFYCIEQNEIKYVFSDFFLLDNAFDSVPYFFDDLNSKVIMMCEINGEYMSMKFTKGSMVFWSFLFV